MTWGLPTLPVPGQVLTLPTGHRFGVLHVNCLHTVPHVTLVELTLPDGTDTHPDDRMVIALPWQGLDKR